jgi:hypothetical protein
MSLCFFFAIVNKNLATVNSRQFFGQQPHVLQKTRKQTNKETNKTFNIRILNWRTTQYFSKSCCLRDIPKHVDPWHLPFDAESRESHALLFLKRLAVWTGWWVVSPLIDHQGKPII